MIKDHNVMRYASRAEPNRDEPGEGDVGKDKKRARRESNPQPTG